MKLSNLIEQIKDIDKDINKDKDPNVFIWVDGERYELNDIDFSFVQENNFIELNAKADSEPHIDNKEVNENPNDTDQVRRYIETFNCREEFVSFEFLQRAVDYFTVVGIGYFESNSVHEMLLKFTEHLNEEE